LPTSEPKPIYPHLVRQSARDLVDAVDALVAACQMHEVQIPRSVATAMLTAQRWAAAHSGRVGT
jgi:hypothetical protein